MTPAIATRWIEEVQEGERLPFALMCYDTNDRLTYQAWINDLVRYIRQTTVVIEHYEDGIRQAQQEAIDSSAARE